MTHIELNAILYYADFLSLKALSRPVTDNCKYFFIRNCPINSAYIIDLEPEYDADNPYIQQAMLELLAIQDKYDEEGSLSFIDEICSIKACGSVDAEQMLKCIHRYSTKHERKQAFNAYQLWKKEQFYSHITLNENGDPQETQCTRYVAHCEKRLKRLGLLKSPELNSQTPENQA